MLFYVCSNHKKTSFMKKFTPLILLVFLALAFSSCFWQDKKDDPNNVTPDDTTTAYAAAYWKFAAGDSFVTANSSINGTQIESDCDNNNKMWIVLGAMPTANGEMKIVNYNKTSLASDELRIDIAHGSDDYLTTGSDSAKATITMDNGKVNIDFANVRFQRYTTNGPANDSTTISGYLDQK